MMKGRPAPLLIVSRSAAGSVLLVVVVLVALLAAVVMGHLQVNTEEIQLERNHAGSAEAVALAEAGLNEALAQLQRDPRWNAGIAEQPFAGGTYTVVVRGSTVAATGVTARGFAARIEAEVAAGAPAASGPLEIHRWRINP